MFLLVAGFPNIFWYFFGKKKNIEITFCKCIDERIVFNRYNFQKIFIFSSKSYPKDLILKHIDTDNISFLNLKIKKNGKKWPVTLYDKRKEFNFNFNSLINWYSCISRKVLRNITLLQINRVRHIYNNEVELKITFEEIKRALQVKC